MAFYIDGQLQGTYIHSGQDLNSSFEYNVSVFSISNLPPGEHHLGFQNGQANTSESLALLDYIVYTVDEKSSPSHNTPNIVVIAVVVPLVACLLISTIIYLLRRRKLRQASGDSEAPIWIPHFHGWKRGTLAPVPPSAMDTWVIEPISLPPSHPASGWVNGSGRPVTRSVPSAPTASSQQGHLEASRRSHRPLSSTTSMSSYGRVIYIHNLTDS
jgi:hypothetical protein